MATAQDIKWGGYGKYEGPFYRGKFPYVPPAEPNESEKILAIVAATEGRTDAINMYDGQILSSGPIQNVERAQYSVSAMLGAVSSAHNRELWQYVQEALGPALVASGANFEQNGRNRWRFFFHDERGEVDREDEQRQLMHLNSNGQKGTWDEGDKAHGKLWAACVATVFENEKARAAQAAWLVPRLRRYAFRESARFIEKASEVGTPESLCFVAAYLTFAINNPTRANKHLLIGDKATKHPRFSLPWLIDVLKELTFGPHISIYPHRYDAIRKHLEKHYGVDLPDFAKELEDWRVVSNHDYFFEPKEVQEALISLGYNLGPAGADGIFGGKTRKALWTFEELHEVKEPDGMMDPQTAVLLEQELLARGIELLR
jgi:hypothetical protein